MSIADYLYGFFRRKPLLPEPDEALVGRVNALVIDQPHAVLRTAVMPEFPDGTHIACFAMGCFWGGEELFWQQPGVYTTAVGYSGGYTPNPTYEEVCSGKTGHTEVVLIVYWPNLLRFEQLLQLFWSNHNPTQGMRQGHDLGTQYRSAVYWYSEEQKLLAEDSLQSYQRQLLDARQSPITTEIIEAGEFYYAEAYHQQYLAKNPGANCVMQTCGKSGLPLPVTTAQ